MGFMLAVILVLMAETRRSSSSGVTAFASVLLNSAVGSGFGVSLRALSISRKILRRSRTVSGFERLNGVTKRGVDPAGTPGVGAWHHALSETTPLLRKYAMARAASSDMARDRSSEMSPEEHGSMKIDRRRMMPPLARRKSWSLGPIVAIPRIVSAVMPLEGLAPVIVPMLIVS